MPQLAGLPIHESVVYEIASLLRDAGSLHTAKRLEDALAHDRPIVALSTRDREKILSVLDDPPEGLLELRAVLLNEHAWRGREDLDLPPPIDPLDDAGA